MAEFRKVDSSCRVIFATETLGTGIDLPFPRVYQYRLLVNKHLAVIFQRMGRAARRAGTTGTFSLLVDESLHGDCGSSRATGEIADVSALEPLEKYRETVDNSYRKRALPVTESLLTVSQKQVYDKDTVLWDEEKSTVNKKVLEAFCKTTGCRRRLLLEFFRDTVNGLASSDGGADDGDIPTVFGTPTCCLRQIRH